MLCVTAVHSDTHTHEQLLKTSIGLRLGLVFVCLFWFSIMCVFWFSIGYFVLVFAFVVLGLVSSVLCREIGWEERLRYDLFCVEQDVKP